MNRHTSQLAFFVVIVLLFNANQIKAQEWVRQHPDVDITDMKDVYVSEDGNGWAVGTEIIFHTTDFGEHWVEQDGGLPPIFWKTVNYVEGSNGQVAFFSSNNMLYKTADAGNTIQVVDVEGATSTDFKEIFMPKSETIVLLSASQVLRSSDAGETWEVIFEAPGQLFSLAFADETFAWISQNDGTLMRSTDTGTSWTEINDAPFLTAAKLTFVDENLGFANADKHVYRTQDGGQNWELISENAFPLNTLGSFEAASASKLYGTMNIRIYYSEDGGVTWHFTIGVPYSRKWEGLHTLPDGRAWVAGSYSAIAYSETPAENWEDQVPGNKNRLKFIRFFDDNIGLAGGRNLSLLKTTDGGDNWQDISFPSSNSFETFNDCWFISENDYLLAANNTVYQTSDGGQNWTGVLSGTEFLKFFQAPDGDLFASNYNGNVYRSSDNGANWDILPTGFNFWLNSLHFVSETTGYACGKDGLIIKTEDTGNSWQQQNSGIDKDLSDIFFTSEQTGFATINNWNDSLLYTNNAGDTWTKIGLPVTDICSSIYFQDEQNGWISTGSASSGRVLKTDDGGLTWEEFYLNSFAFNDIEVRTDGTSTKVWVAGIGGVIEYWTGEIVGLQTPNLPVVQINTSPNPFDGKTLNIHWPKNISETVQLKLYNTIGRLVENQKVDTQNALFKFSNTLPEGIYFLQITDNQLGVSFVNKVLVNKE